MTHFCPAGCGARVPMMKFACLLDWRRLPKELQRAIWDTVTLPTWEPERVAAVADALHWYEENPRD